MAWPSFMVIPLDFTDILALQPVALSAVTAYALVMIFDIGGAMYGLGNMAGLVGAMQPIGGAAPDECCEAGVVGCHERRHVQAVALSVNGTCTSH